LPPLNPNDPVKAGIEELNSCIAAIARNCIEVVLGRSCIIDKRWSIIDRLRGDFRHNVYLRCRSDRYQAIAAFGAGEVEIQEFIGVNDSGSILDVFGEMLNIYFGMLMDNDMFTRRFGILTQSIPGYSASANCFPRAWGCHGNLITPNNGSLYMGFAIKCIRISSPLQ
jgi:hypothetical protein